MKKIFQSKAGKAIIITLIAIVVIVTVWSILKAIGVVGKSKDQQKEDELSKQLDSELRPGTVTISDVDAINYAEKLYMAMKGAGTDEDAIYEVFSKVQSKSDILTIMKRFGVRDGKTLTEWLTSELSAKERTKLNSILAQNEVDYAF